MTNGSRLPCEHIDHALAVAEVYFTLSPFQWLYEPIYRFTHGGKDLVFNPDAIAAFHTKEGKKMLICVEVQRTPLSEKQWHKKMSVYNAYFQEAYKKSDFQQWKSKSEPITPHIVVVSSQKNVCGLDVPNRNLIVINEITSLI